MVNNTSVISPLASPEAVVRLAIYTGSLVFGSIGGLVVLGTILSKRGKKNDNDIFLMNLAVSDMTTIWFYVGVHFNLLSGGLQRTVFCEYVWPFMSVPLSVSIFTISSIAVLRCRGIIFIWKPSIRRNTAIAWTTGLWLFALLVFIPASMVSKSAVRYCYLDWHSASQRRFYTSFLFAVQYAIPLVLVLCAYISIGVNLKNYEGQVVRPQDVKKENLDIIKALSIVAISFAVLLLPLQVGWMLWEFGNPRLRKIVLKFMNYADILCIFHSCLNPFIYGIFPKSFRNQYAIWTSTALHCLNITNRRRQSRNQNSSSQESNALKPAANATLFKLRVYVTEEKEDSQEPPIQEDETVATVQFVGLDRHFER